MKPRFFIAALVGAAVVLFYNYGPEFLQFNMYRIYKEIQQINYRLDAIENK